MQPFLGYHPDFLKSTKYTQSGLTLIELMVVVGILGVLFSLTTISLTGLIPKANVSSSIDTLIADLKHQQQKAMLGESGTSNATASAQPFGVHIDSNQYVLYGGISYSAASSSNSAIPVASTIQLSTTFGSGNILFNRGAGDISAYASGSGITVTDTTTNIQKVIQLNKFGVVTGVN